MVKLDDNDKKFIRDNFTDADAIIASDNPRDVLRLIYDLIDEKGFAPPHYYNYNDFGREAQRVYDNIFLNNAPAERLARSLQPINT